jgi:hypothetical protein
VEDLAERRTALDRLDDQLSALIQHIEPVLRRQVSTRITCLINRRDDALEYLTFGEHDGRLMLLIERGVPKRNGTILINNSTPLRSASREMRALGLRTGMSRC